MSSSPARVLIALIGLTLIAASGCDGADAEAEPDAAIEDVDDADAGPRYDIADGPLQVGYARVEIPWRVGAKPGQVGTAGADGLEVEMLEAIGDLLPTIQGVAPDESRPAPVFEEATDWALDLLEEQTDNTEPGEYANWYEPGDGIEQPPDVKATVIRRGDLKVAVVRADVYLMHDYLQMRVADLVADSTGLDREQIFLAGTHNHSVAQPSSPAPGVWSLADGFDPRHFVYLTRGIAEAIERADDNLRDARLRTARTSYDDVQFNIIGPATTEVAPDDDSEPEVVHAGYPYDHFDDDLDLLYFDEAEPPHEPIALVFSLGMHPETLPSGHGLISAEFPAHTEKRLRERTGVSAMWLPGALGDIEPDGAENNPDHDFWRHSYDALHQLSATLADGVEEAFDDLVEEVEPTTEPKLRNISRDIPGTEDYAIPTSAYLEGMRMVTPRVLHASSLIRLQAIRVGDALLMGIPAEVTTDLSWNIKSRVNDEDGDVYQGYVWPDNPQWVADRVARNFSTAQLTPDEGAPIPIVTSMVNGYIGYVVTRWEYENREHYRQEMTPHGPDSADHLASAMVDLVREMMGGPAAEFDYPRWLDADLKGVDRLMAFFESLDEVVPDIERQLPAGDPEMVGTVAESPTGVAADAIDDDLATDPAVTFQWHGGTHDLPPPQVTVQRRDGDDWKTVAEGPGRSIHLLNDGGDVWTARFIPAVGSADIGTDNELRFQVRGLWRTDTDGVSEPDPLFDPDGRNDTYEVVGEPFQFSEFDGLFE